MKTLDTGVVKKLTGTDSDFNIDCIINEWAAYARRKNALNIRKNVESSFVRSVLITKIDTLNKKMKEVMEGTEKSAERIRIAYDTPEGSEARQWAELMLKAWAGDGEKK